MTKLLVTDELWEVIEPLLPEEEPKSPKEGGHASTTAPLSQASYSC
jgi:transposase